MILSFLSFFINMPCIAYCMFSSDTNPSTIGLLMVYALSVSDNVVGIAQSEAGLESKLVSIERIYKFMNI
jgi:ABC-type multidrug transport system fused ATPase/permease subunit